MLYMLFTAKQPYDASPAIPLPTSSPALRPFRETRFALLSSRKKPEGLPQLKSELVLNSKVRSLGLRLQALRSGGFEIAVGCLLKISMAMTEPKLWAIRWTLPYRLNPGLLRHHSLYTRLASLTTAAVIFSL